MLFKEIQNMITHKTKKKTQKLKILIIVHTLM